MKDYWACKRAFEEALAEGAMVVVHYFAAGQQTCEGMPTSWGAMVSIVRKSDGKSLHIRPAYVFDITRGSLAG